MMTPNQCACVRCGKVWRPRWPRLSDGSKLRSWAPVACPACKSTGWNTPREEQTHCAACGQMLPKRAVSQSEIDKRILDAAGELSQAPDYYCGMPCGDVALAEVVEKAGLEYSQPIANHVARTLRRDGWGKYQKWMPDRRRAWRYRKMLPGPLQTPVAPPAPPAPPAHHGSIINTESLTADEIRGRMRFATEAERAELNQRLSDLIAAEQPGE